MKKYLVEYELIPNGAINYLVVEAKSKKSAIDFVEKSYSPSLIKKANIYKETI